MPKTDLEKDALLELVKRYEDCYEGIIEYIDKANGDRRIGIAEMYGEVVDRLARTFDPENVQKELPNAK